MTTKVLLRIAAVLLVIHTLGHLMGHLGWDKPEDKKMQAVVDAMHSYSAAFMGAHKSMADYYNGYSLMMFGLFGMTISLLWILSIDAEKQMNIVRRLLYPVAIAYLFFGAIEFGYFFPFAGAISSLVGLLVLTAAIRLSVK